MNGRESEKLLDSYRRVRVTGSGADAKSGVMFRDKDSSRAGARAVLSITCREGCLPVI